MIAHIHALAVPGTPQARLRRWYDEALDIFSRPWHGAPALAREFGAALEEALLAFTGCVLVVSHDRYFLNRVCTGIVAFEADREVVYNEGDYDYYREKLAERPSCLAKRPEATRLRNKPSQGAKPKAPATGVGD